MALQDVLADVERLVAEGDLRAALSVCEDALSRRLSSNTRTRLLLWQARIIVTLDGQWGGPAIAYLKSALESAGNDTELRARVLATFTAAYAAVGAVAECRRYRREFIQLHKAAASSGVKAFYPYVEYNFGLACHEAGLLEAAEGAYLLALSEYVGRRGPSVESFVADVKMNLVDVYQEVGQHEQAYHLLTELDKVLPDSTFGAISRLRHAIYRLFRGDTEHALLLTEMGLAHPACDARTQAHLLLTKAQILRNQGHDSDAHTFAFEAMRVAANARCHYLCHRVSNFIGMLARGES